MDKPDGLYVIRPEIAEEFIEQLAVRKFFGVGKVTEKKMHSLNIYTGRDLKALSKAELEAKFGKSGNYYYNIARGIDDRPVRAHRVRKSIGAETTFGDNLLDKRLIWKKLQSLSERIERTLENQQMRAKTVTLKVKYSDFVLNTRSKTLDQSIVSKDQVLDVLPELLKKTEVGKRPIRLIGVSVSGLMKSNVGNDHGDELNEPLSDPQLGLF